jgi:hypothetical protein
LFAPPSTANHITRHYFVARMQQSLTRALNKILHFWQDVIWQNIKQNIKSALTILVKSKMVILNMKYQTDLRILAGRFDSQSQTLF